MIEIEVLQGSSITKKSEWSKDVVRIGRGEGNDLVLADGHVSSEHARLVLRGDRWTLVDMGSTNGSAVLRGETRLVLTDPERERELETGDLIEFGSQDRVTRLQVRIKSDGPEARVVAMRRIAELDSGATIVERDDNRVRALYDAQKKIGAALDLNLVLVAVADASLELLPQATHVTVVIRDDDEDASSVAASGYVPVLTRVRGQDGPSLTPVPVTRSIFRKVLAERAAVLAADAVTDVGSTESLMGASIRSTLGVPLWKGDEILGVLQVDNRETPGMFSTQDLELMAVLGNNASLAVANARLLKRLRAAEERLRKENQYLKGKEQERRTGAKGQSAPEIIGDSPVMQKLIQQLDKVVDTRVTVLIEGETGVGKELVAASVHYRSKRKDKMFIGQNCAAMPENLLESELFGHRKGSFTGAVADKVGKVEAASGGTLFLDEIGEMPMNLQVKLLRVLQERVIERIGDLSPRAIDVRVVAATHRDVTEMIQSGGFREDLYYRLNEITLSLPPLRDRGEDIGLLAKFFLNKYREIYENARPTGFTNQALTAMLGYYWPGNVRELENRIKKALIMSDRTLLNPDDLGLTDGGKRHVKPLAEAQEEFKLEYIRQVLELNNWNKAQTARDLGVDARTIFRYIERMEE